MTPDERGELNALFLRLQRGERAALEPAYARVLPVITALCAKLLGATSDADDATQNAMLKIFEQLNEYDPQRDALSWCIAIAVWECRTVRRQKSRRAVRETEFLDAEHHDAADLEAQISQRSVLDALDDLLSRLPEQQREALIASLEGEQANPTQRKRKQRAIAQLRRWWEMFHGDA